MKITVFTTYLTRYEGEMSQIRLNVIQKLQNRWETKFLDNMNFKTLEKLRKWAFSRVFCGLREIHKLS